MTGGTAGGDVGFTLGGPGTDGTPTGATTGSYAQRQAKSSYSVSVSNRSTYTVTGLTDD